MPQLTPLPFDSPGAAGLNLQAQSSILSPEWATVLDNAVIDEQGRIALRKGTRAVHTADVANTVDTIFTSIQSDGTKYKHCADNSGDLYNNATTATTMTNRSGTATLASDGNYKYQNFNNKVIAFHSEGSFLVQATPTGNFADISFALHSLTTMNDVLAAFGRLWVVTDSHLYWSNLLDETTWRTSGTATDAGFLELNQVWPDGRDVGVALAEFNGYLVIFGEHSVVVYDKPVDPLDAAFVKVEAIDGIGCVGRDTVQVIGRDLLFVSNSGVKSLGRVIQEKSLPLNDSLPQVRDDLLSQALSSSIPLKTAYSQNEGLYVLLTSDKTYAVNVKQQLDTGSYRATTWSGSFRACHDDGDGGLLLSSGARVYNYVGYEDGADTDGTGGSSYSFKWESGWIDFSTVVQGAGPLIKAIKKLSTSIAGGSGATLTFKWWVDYKNSGNSISKFIPISDNQSQYGIAQYNLDTYGVDVDVRRIGSPASKVGRVIKIGVTLAGCTGAAAINRADVYATMGHVRN